MHCDPACRNAYNATALHLAVSKLMDTSNSSYDTTSLYYAAEFGQPHIVTCFTDEKGYNLLCLEELNKTPLHCEVAYHALEALYVTQLVHSAIYNLNVALLIMLFIVYI